MPTYVCTIPTGLLDDIQKREVAKAITRNHHKATGAPLYFVQVILDENTTAQRYLGGEPADDQVWIRANIRFGRTEEQRSALMLAIMQDVARIADIDEAMIWIYLCNLEPTDMVEYGHLLPQPGREKDWFDCLPSALKEHLVSLGTKKRDFTL